MANKKSQITNRNTVTLDEISTHDTERVRSYVSFRFNLNPKRPNPEPNLQTKSYRSRKQNQNRCCKQNQNRSRKLNQNRSRNQIRIV
jgi:hypothetical protein